MKSKCEICKNDLPNTYGGRRFCSRICYAKYRSIYLTGKKSGRWNGGLCSQKKKCKVCNVSFVGRKDRIFCSKRCLYKGRLNIGGKNGMWKGGKTGGNGNYVFLLKPSYPQSNKNGYILEHRFLMEKKLGRSLRKDEIVHHKNEIKSDNRLCNLQLLSKIEHDRLHTIKRHKKQKLFTKLNN